ncbi:hypothetical protein VCRA2123E76_40047 [Vibrio crassostreae]|nr:hypothetical protein VCRA2123E76_40047 [Vibrio crassostreae]
MITFIIIMFSIGFSLILTSGLWQSLESIILMGECTLRYILSFLYQRNILPSGVLCVFLK